MTKYTRSLRFKDAISLTRWLGKGGMCSVAEFWDSLAGTHRAGKMLRWSQRNDPHSRDRVRKEGRMLAAVSHPHVLPVFDLLESDAIGPIVVVERAEGPLRLTEAPVAMEEGLSIAFAMLSGLAALHVVGMLHRDVKPGNLLRMEDGRVVLADLNIGKGGPERQLSTRTGEILGTYSYSAPEQLQSSSTVDTTADVYAAGATLYRVFTGRRSHTLWRSELEPNGLAEVPAYIRPVIAKATRMEPRRRYRDAADMLDDFRVRSQGLIGSR